MSNQDSAGQPASGEGPVQPSIRARGEQGMPRRPLVGGFLMAGAARGTAEGLLAIRGLVLAGLLGPQLFGIWAAFRIATHYSSFLGAGVFRGLEIEVSHARASAAPGAPDDAAAWGRAAVAYLLVVFGPLTVAAVAAARATGLEWLAFLLSGLAGGLLLNRLWIYGSTYLRATGSLRRYGLLEVAHATAQLALTAALAAVWGLAGAFAGFALASAAGVLLVARHVPFRPALSVARVRVLLRAGFPLGLAGIFATALATVDRIVIGALGGPAQLGQYAFAVAVAGLAASVAWVIRTVIFPEVYGRSRIDGATPTVHAYLERTLLPFGRLLPPVVGLLALCLEPLVSFALPRYAAALPALRIFVFTGVAAGLATLGTLGLVAARQQARLPVMTAATAVLNLLLSFVALQTGFGLAGVAAGALLSRAALGVGVLLTLAAATGYRRRARLLLQFLGPLGWCTLLVSAISQLLPSASLGSVALSIGLYIVALAPLLPGIAGDLRQMVARSS